MPTELEARILRAVTEGRKARSAYYAAVELPDEQELGPPATPAAIAKLEARVGRPLPPSYRTFLSLHDGWKMASGAMDLLSIKDRLEGPMSEAIKKWQEKALKAGDKTAGAALVIGWDKVTASRLLLDPRVPAGEKEWPVIEHHRVEEGDYPDFLAWLEESNEDFRELAREEKEGGGA